MNIELSHNNHFKFGYDGKPFSLRSNEAQKWFVDYGPCTQEPMDFKEECFRAAKIISEKHPGNVWVLFSGGVDSEVALRSFVEQGLPVKVAIARFANDLNIHDISYAVIVCEKLKVPYYFFELNLLEFWSTEAIRFAERTYCTSPQLLTTMWLADQVPGYPVLGSGECLFVKRTPEGYIPGVSPYEESPWDLWEKEKIASWYRHFMVNERNACPGFFQYTPELMLSYLLDPYVYALIESKIPGKLTTESSKLAIYQQHFDLLDRPKFTGFERVQAEDAVFRAQLTARFPYHSQVVKTECQGLIRRLRAST